MILILIIVVLSFAMLSGFLLYSKKPIVEKPKPSIDIGCDMVFWNRTQTEIVASIKNIDKPTFNWTIDGISAGNTSRFTHEFDIGEHSVILNVSFDNKTLEATQAIIVIDSIDGIDIGGSQASKNLWGFQTTYRGKNFGVKDVMVSVDSQPPAEVSRCGYLATKELLAGEHVWKAYYQGEIITSGSFILKEASEMKISKVEVAPVYMAGDTVNGKVVLKNTGSIIINEFDLKTLVVNNNFAWMGDKARREYFNKYESNLKPGEMYEIIMDVTIPEKVSGIRPSGKYSITLSTLLNGQITDSKVVNTEVK